MRRSQTRRSFTFALTGALALACVLALAPAASASRVISNGTVSLGVNDLGQLLHEDFTRFVGITYEPTGNDGLRPGCQCEGWGVGVVAAGASFSGSVENAWTGPDGANLDLESFTSTATTATSVASVDGKLRVTHEFAPSAATPNLYEIKVTLTNIGAAGLPEVRYRRLMDWNAEPYPFDGFVTIQRGATPAPAGNLVHSNDNGYANPDPLVAAPSIYAGHEDANYDHFGMASSGALFDFSFGSLAAGASKSFRLYYGAAGSLQEAQNTVSTGLLELYSFGEPGNDFDRPLVPNTFLFGFRATAPAPPVAPPLGVAPESVTAPPDPVATSAAGIPQRREPGGDGEAQPPAAILSGSTSQKLGPSVAVRVSCPRAACRSTATGVARVPRIGATRPRTYALVPSVRRAGRGAPATLRPRLPRAARAAIRGALRRGRTTAVSLRVAVEDARGAKTTLTRKIRLRP